LLPGLLCFQLENRCERNLPQLGPVPERVLLQPASGGVSRFAFRVSSVELGLRQGGAFGASPTLLAEHELQIEALVYGFQLGDLFAIGLSFDKASRDITSNVQSFPVSQLPSSLCRSRFRKPRSSRRRTCCPPAGGPLSEPSPLSISDHPLSSEFRVPSSEFRVPSSEFRVPGSRFQVPGSRFQVPGSRFQVPGSRFRVPGSRFPGSRFPCTQLVPRLVHAGVRPSPVDLSSRFTAANAPSSSSIRSLITFVSHS
jgi:hypothetical protein